MDPAAELVSEERRIADASEHNRLTENDEESIRFHYGRSRFVIIHTSIAIVITNHSGVPCLVAWEVAISESG